MKNNYDKIVEERQVTIDNLNKVIVELEEEIQESRKKMAKPEDHTLPKVNIACQVDFPDDSSTGCKNQSSYSAPVLTNDSYPGISTNESDIIQKIKSNVSTCSLSFNTLQIFLYLYK